MRLFLMLLIFANRQLKKLVVKNALTEKVNTFTHTSDIVANSNYKKEPNFLSGTKYRKRLHIQILILERW